jgi:hypothetical protein
MAQYISMYPADENNTRIREVRIRSCRGREPPEGFALPGDPRGNDIAEILLDR